MMYWNDAVNFAFYALDRIVNVNDQNGKITVYTYDAAGQLLTQLVNDPSDKKNKQILHTYTYGPQGNILHEVRTGAGGQDNFDRTHVYDALNRLTATNGYEGQKSKDHTYEYDSLGNLLYEKNANGNNKGNEYWYNNLNQQIQKLVDNKDNYTYTFDYRGNLIKGVYNKQIGNPSKDEIMEQYIYDATRASAAMYTSRVIATCSSLGFDDVKSKLTANRMVKGSKYLGTSVDYEYSYYIYNGLGYLVGNEWIIAKNGYGYHGVGLSLDPSEQVNGVVVCDRHSHVTGNGHINHTGKGYTTGGTTGGAVPKIDNKKYAVVHKDHVIDYTSPLQNIIMETESGDGGLTYRYSYGLQKDNVVIYGIPNGAGSLLQKQNYPSGAQNIVKLYYHHDHLGSTDYLTDNVAGKVTSYATYDDWGELTAKAIVKMGVRMLDLVQEYTGHSYDQVLGIYYAKARMYDAAVRRFMAVDWAGSNLAYTQTFNQYAYVINNPIKYVDLFGLYPALVPGVKINVGDKTLDLYFDYVTNTYYVDFFEAAVGWDVRWQLLPDELNDGEFRAYTLYSPNDVYKTRISMFMDNHTNKLNYTWNSKSSRLFTTGDGLYLVELDYFAKLMCAAGWNKEYSFTIPSVYLSPSAQPGNLYIDISKPKM